MRNPENDARTEAAAKAILESSGGGSSWVRVWDDASENVRDRFRTIAEAALDAADATAPKQRTQQELIAAVMDRIAPLVADLADRETIAAGAVYEMLDALVVVPTPSGERGVEYYVGAFETLNRVLAELEEPPA